jgi:hypothetical protein
MNQRGSILRPPRHYVIGGLLVGTMLLAYCLVLAASMRRADRHRSAEASLLQARMVCELLPLAHARGACVKGVLRGDAPMQRALP